MSDKNLDGVLKDLNKLVGSDVVGVVGSEKGLTIEAIPTTCLSLDHVLACGGLPRGRILEIFGAESSGKSTLAMHLCSIVQKAGGRAAWIDAEFSFARNYSESVGMNVDELILAQPESGEDAMEVARALVKENLVDILVVDSVSALVPKDELDKPFDKETMAKQARMMSRALRVLTGAIAQTKTSVIFINQTRSKIGIVFGKKETTSGGNALKFYASIRLQVYKGKQIKDDNDEVIGNWMKVINIKNKVGLPFRQGEFELYFGSGIDILGDVVDFAKNMGVIKRAGSSYSYKEAKLGIGRNAAKEFLIKNDKILVKIKKEVKEKYDTNGESKQREKTGNSADDQENGQDIA